MTLYKELIEISECNGVENFLFVSSKGRVIAHNFSDYERTGPVIAFCGKLGLALGKHRLKFMTFNRSGKQDLLIFPVGNYYLAVIKEKGITSDRVGLTILQFLENLTLKYDRRQSPKNG